VRACLTGNHCWLPTRRLLYFSLSTPENLVLGTLIPVHRDSGTYARGSLSGYCSCPTQQLRIFASLFLRIMELTYWLNADEEMESDLIVKMEEVNLYSPPPPTRLYHWQCQACPNLSLGSVGGFVIVICLTGTGGAYTYLPILRPSHNESAQNFNSRFRYPSSLLIVSDL
jgi:hypothetical protein